MKPNLNNTVVLSLNPEHGAEIIKAWKALGVDTQWWIGINTNEYYGIIEKKFNCYKNIDVENVTVITLLELQAMAKPKEHPMQNRLVDISVIENIIKYCEDKAVYDKLGNYGDFYYKLKRLVNAREIE